MFGSLSDHGSSADDRVGLNAWTAVYGPGASNVALNDGASEDAVPETIPSADPSAWRAFYQRLQRALHDGYPLPLGFQIIDAQISDDGHITAPPSQIADIMDFGGHEVLITDYQATNVPDFGTLKAGAKASDAEKEAALDDQTQISFFRVKNSWGTGERTSNGYNDIDTAYLEQPAYRCSMASNPTVETCEPYFNKIGSVVLPPGY